MDLLSGVAFDEMDLIRGVALVRWHESILFVYAVFVSSWSTVF